jgi:serine/threonine protein kinase/WD40 repeat protein
MSEPDREETIFNSLLALPPERRQEHLDRECAGDADLRRRVTELLEAHDVGDCFMAASAAANLTDMRVPISEKPCDSIGRYKLMEQIGEGGCGVVYVAEQQEPVRRRVALKLIKLGMDTKQVMARFEAERQALALMEHPNIAKVLDAGATESGRPYFVMELVRGIKITDYCDLNHLTTAERLELFIQVCQAIQHAHQKGVIHRDIKPSNILVTVNDGAPVPKVIDFGIAKATQGRLTDQTIYTAFEQFIGTPAYMSPEQAVMTSLDVDTRSDIYSLGVLLYELLTGKTPFETKELLAAGLDAMRQTIREREPRKPSTRLSTMLAADLSSAAQHRRVEAPKLINSVRGDLDWIVMKALEKDRTRRYETANALAADIQRHLDCEPIVARPPGSFYRTGKFIQRNKLPFAAGSAAAVAALVALVVLLASYLQITRERNQKDVALRQRSIALNAATASEQQAKDQLFLALKNQAQARRFSRQIGQRLDSLTALNEAGRIKSSDELRDEAIAAMALPDVRKGPIWKIADDPSTLVEINLTSYERYARVDKEGVVSIRTIPDNREVQRFQSSPVTLQSTVARTLWFSPDDRFFAKLEENHKFRVWRLDDARPVLQNEPTNCFAIAFAPDSRRVVVSQRDWILCFDLTTGREQNRWQSLGLPYSLTFSPDGMKVAVGYTKSNSVSIYDAQDGRELANVAVGSSAQEMTAWHPDGKHLAVGGSDPRIQIWELESVRKIAVLEGHVQQITALGFHPRGELLASTGWDAYWHLWGPTPPREMMRFATYGWQGFSKNGRWAGVVRCGDTQVQLLEIVPSSEYHTFIRNFTNGETCFYQGDISPDGRVLALPTQDGVRFWSIYEGRELAQLPIGMTTSACFHSGDRELMTCGPDPGLQYRPVDPAEFSAGNLRLGLAKRVPLPFSPMGVVSSSDGATIAVTGETVGQAAVLELTGESRLRLTVTHSNITSLALSPNGQWLATSGWHSEDVRLWDATTGKLIKQFVVGPSRVFFTPDNRELIISRNRDFTFHDLRTLELSRRIEREPGLYPEPVAYSPDGKLMAMELAAGVIHLKAADTGRTVAKLEDPFGDLATWLGFTPDGTQLIVAATYTGAIHRWDLRAIRVRLKSMGLDWDWPEFPAKSVAENRSSPEDASLRVEVTKAAK